MAWFDEFSGLGAASERAEKAWRVPMGVVSPLWLAFGAAASAGVAYWWMTRWTKAVNVEALERPAEPEAAAAPVAATAPEPELALEPEAAPAIEAAPVAPAETVAEAPDDLTRMNGVGPKLSEALAARGVTRFAQIAAWTAEDLADVDKALSLKGRAVREAWVAQAKRFAQAS